MPHVTKTDRLLEAAIHEHAGDPDRVMVLERTRWFKRSWIDLAEALLIARDNESYLRWGHASFHDYCHKELHLKRGTVDKLCASFGFLRANAPRLVRADDDDHNLPAIDHIPSWQSVDFVARAQERGAADKNTLDEIKRAVFEDALPVPQLARRYREVAFPVASQERRARLRKQILAAGRRLAGLVVDPEAAVPRRLAERVEIVIGELVTELDRASDDDADDDSDADGRRN